MINIFSGLNALQLHHNECDGISKYWCLDCLLNGLLHRFHAKKPVTRKMFPFDDVFISGLMPGNDYISMNLVTTLSGNSFLHIWHQAITWHYNVIIMSMMMVSQITSISIVCSTICSGLDKRKHQSSTSLAFGRGIQNHLEQNSWLVI